MIRVYSLSVKLTLSVDGMSSLRSPVSFIDGIEMFIILCFER